MSNKNVILLFYVHVLAVVLCFLFFSGKAEAKKKLETIKPSFVKVPTSEDKKILLMKPRKDEKTILCTDEKVQRVRVTFGRITTLNFPVAPKEVLPGEAVFDFKKIRNDLNIKSLSPRARTNIVVYLQERRCNLDLTTVPSGGDDIIFVRDPAEKQFEVRFQ